MNEFINSPGSFTLFLLFVVISWYGFGHSEFLKKYVFHPFLIKRNGQWYRFVSAGFIHKDIKHLIFNAFVWYQFSIAMELYFIRCFLQWGSILLVVLFISGVIVSHISGYIKNMNNPYYSSLGASGGVSSILFAFILVSPVAPLRFFFIPINIPAFLVGIGYLLYSLYFSRKDSMDNVNHEAHYFGGIWGCLFMLLIKPSLFFEFFDQVFSWFDLVF